MIKKIISLLSVFALTIGNVSAYTPGPTEYSIPLDGNLVISSGSNTSLEVMIPFDAETLEITYNSSVSGSITAALNGETKTSSLKNGVNTATVDFSDSVMGVGDAILTLSTSTSGNITVSDLTFTKKNGFFPETIALDIEYSEYDAAMQTSVVLCENSVVIKDKGAIRYLSVENPSATAKKIGGVLYAPGEMLAAALDLYYQDNTNNILLRSSDNKKEYTETDIVTENGVLYLPVSKVAEAFGAYVYEKNGFTIIDYYKLRGKAIVENSTVFTQLKNEFRAYSGTKVYGTEYHVSAAAEFSGNGSAELPFKTISEAAAVAVAGDRVIIHEGVYRETVRPKKSGTAVNPITYEAAEGEAVTVSAFDEVSDFRPYNGSMYVAELKEKLEFGTDFVLPKENRYQMIDIDFSDFYDTSEGAENIYTIAQLREKGMPINGDSEDIRVEITEDGIGEFYSILNGVSTDEHKSGRIWFDAFEDIKSGRYEFDVKYKATTTTYASDYARTATRKIFTLNNTYQYNNWGDDSGYTETPNILVMNMKASTYGIGPGSGVNNWSEPIQKMIQQSGQPAPWCYNTSRGDMGGDDIYDLKIIVESLSETDDWNITVYDKRASLTTPITTWTASRREVPDLTKLGMKWRGTKDKHNVTTQVYSWKAAKVSGQPKEGREPDYHSSGLSYPSFVTSPLWPTMGDLKSVKYPTAVESETAFEKGAANALKGASIVMFKEAAWFLAYGRVMASTKGMVLTDDQTQMHYFKYSEDNNWGYMTNCLETVDTPGEWYANNGALYMIPPEGMSGEELTVEARQRYMTFDLNDRSFIHIRGINTTGGTITMAGDGQMNIVDGGKHTYISHFTLPKNAKGQTMSSPEAVPGGNVGMCIGGIGNVFVNAEVSQSAGGGLVLCGKYSYVRGNVISDISYQGLGISGIAIQGHAENKDNIAGGGHRILHNTVYNTGRSCYSQMTLLDEKTGKRMPQIASEIAYNEFYYANLIARDSGITYENGVSMGNDLVKTQMHHNVVHDSVFLRGETINLNTGIYHDNNTANADTHHNILYYTDQDRYFVEAVYVQHDYLFPTSYSIVTAHDNLELGYLQSGFDKGKSSNYPDGKIFTYGG